MKKLDRTKKRFGLFIFTVVIFATTFFSFKTTSSDNFFEISKNLTLFSSIYKEIDIFYVDEVEPGKLMKEGIDAMLSSLDPYTNYIPESNIEDYRMMTTGEYGGIGALIKQKDDYIVVAEPYEGFAAHKSGLIAGDKIIEIDGHSTKGKTTSQVSKLLKGQAGTELILLIERIGEDKPLEKKLTREEVKIPSVPYYGLVNDSTGYIKLTSFTHNCAKEVKTAFVELKEKHQIKRLILDIRSNGGGLLHESVKIVNLFVDKGLEVVSTKGRIKEMNTIYKTEFDPVDKEIPLVILVNENSASASEIVSGSIQDLDRGIIIGQRTFGKGLVQQTKNLEYNAKLKLTIAKYYTPSGRCIQKLDYTHKEDDGTVSEVPDSLIKTFETKNGRPVFDGRGVDPDIEVERSPYSQIARSLMSKDYIFDFANQFAFNNEKISEPKEFTLSEETYKKFIEFIKDKDYDYTTRTESKLEELKEIASNEKYFEGAEEEYEALVKKLSPSKTNDLEKFKPDIIEDIEYAIISRYYFQDGRIELSLKRDPFVQKAIDVLSDNTQYTGILEGTIQK